MVHRFSAIFCAFAVSSVQGTSSFSRGKLSFPNSLTIDQNANAETEDKISAKIWDKLVAVGPSKEGSIGSMRSWSKCPVLSRMVDAFASKETTVWDFDNDVDNPEFPSALRSHGSEYAIMAKTKEGGTPKDDGRFPALLAKYNALLTNRRDRVAKIAKRADCPRMLNILGNNNAVVRDAAMFEFTFKQTGVKWTKDDRRKNMATGDPDAKIVKAYNIVRCMGYYPCDKATGDKELGDSNFLHLSPMFRAKKGRGKFGSQKMTRNAGIHFLAAKNMFNRVVNTQGENAIQGSLKDFWDRNGQHDSKRARTDECITSATPSFKDISCNKDSKSEDCLWWKTYCRYMKEEHAATNERKGEIFEAADAGKFVKARLIQDAGEVVAHFEACGVPWVGGVSGSVLEFFAVLEKHYPGEVDDLVILQWMAYYELKGFHSLGEVWIMLHPFLIELGYTKDGTTGGSHRLHLLGIDPPMTPSGCKDQGSNTEGSFLKELDKAVDVMVSSFSDSVLNGIGRAVEKAAAEKAAAEKAAAEKEVEEKAAAEKAAEEKAAAEKAATLEAV